MTATVIDFSTGEELDAEEVAAGELGVGAAASALAAAREHLARIADDRALRAGAPGWDALVAADALVGAVLDALGGDPANQ
ncbi:hypothetical protein [Branchiibius cervicis]|uniref:Uncharacterized protein n=1 Tax=Branchiibius cervicis TaxID=908252 RepID=A0ABW2AX81_9MICO